MVKGPSPLLGYNTNVRHHGKLYHLQTEDSGINHPHIITHLFADGGRVVASRKTSYAEYLGSESLQTVVKRLMQEQHKAMFIALRDGVYDEDEVEIEVEGAATPVDGAPTPVEAAVAAAAEAPVRDPLATPVEPIDIDALERAAAQFTRSAVPAAPTERPSRPVGAGRYQVTRPARAIEHTRQGPAPSSQPESIFGSELLSEKSLDEVILSYLAQDLEEAD